MKQRRSLRAVTAQDPPDPDPENPEETVDAKAVVLRQQTTAVTEWVPRFVQSLDEAVAMVAQKREFFNRVMRKDEHYGVIPGTKGKPVLLKPGAELLCASMGLHPVFRDAAPPVLDYTGEEHPTSEGVAEPFLQYRRLCELRRQIGPGPEDYMVVAQAEGVCNSWESKYRWREGKRKCPNCQREAIIASKFGAPGFLCFKKLQGCGVRFAPDDKRITSQELGRTANVDVLDLENTILKMADKRALVAAVLVGTGCSDLFTQDLDDDVPSRPDAGGEEEPPGPEEETPSLPTPKSQASKKSAAAAASPAPAKAPSSTSAPTTGNGPTSVSTGSTLTPPTPVAMEPMAFGESNSNDLGPLRVRSLELALKATRIHAEKKYPGQVFTQGQLEAQARRSLDTFLQTRRNGKTFATAEAADLEAMIEAIEKTLSTVPAA